MGIAKMSEEVRRLLRAASNALLDSGRRRIPGSPFTDTFDLADGLKSAARALEADGPKEVILIAGQAAVSAFEAGERSLAALEALGSVARWKAPSEDAAEGFRRGVEAMCGPGERVIEAHERLVD